MKGFKLWVEATLSIAMMLGSSIFVACTNGKVNDARSDKQREAISDINDSMRVDAPSTETMIRKGMASCSEKNKKGDSLDFYDYYMHLIQLRVVHGTVDSVNLEYNKVDGFLSRQELTPRIYGMKAYLENARAMSMHMFRDVKGDTKKLYIQTLKDLQMSDDLSSIPNVCANLADTYFDENNLPQAAIWYRRALFVADSLQSPASRQVSLYMGLGHIYTALQNFEEAQKCYKFADEHKKEMPNNMYAYFLNNYGNYFYYKKDFRSALNKFQKLQNFLLKTNHKEDYALKLCWLNMADVYLNLDSIDKAEDFLTRARAFFDKAGNPVAVYYCNTIAIGIADHRKDYKEIKRILASESVPEGVDFSMRNIRNNYLRHYMIDRGDYRKAYETVVADNRCNDSLRQSVQLFRTSDIMSRYREDTLRLHSEIAVQSKIEEVHKIRFAFLFGLFLLVVVVLICLYYISRLRQHRAEQKMQLQQMRLSNLKGRISPHFIFNVLNNSLPTDGREDENLVRLSRLIRSGLDVNAHTFIPLNDELQLVNNYVRVCAPSLGDDFSFVVNAPSVEEQQKLMIPSMFVLILVENAVKHALRNKQGKKELVIDVSFPSDKEDSYIITVSDNGPGFDVTHLSRDREHIGLHIIKSTMMLLGRKKMRLDIHNRISSDNSIAGCDASLILPKNVNLTKHENSYS